MAAWPCRVRDRGTVTPGRAGGAAACHSALLGDRRTLLCCGDRVAQAAAVPVPRLLDGSAEVVL